MTQHDSHTAAPARGSSDAPGDDPLRAALESMAVGVLVWDRDGRLRHANARAAEIAGRAIAAGATAAQVIAELRIQRVGGAEPYPAARLIPPGVFAGDEVAFDDAAIELPDRSRRDVEGRTAPVRDAAGAIGFAVTTFTDVTERRGAEALRAGEAQVLEMVASDQPLLATLTTLARVFEAQADGMLASILLVEDGVRVRHAAAPSLPAAWVGAVDGEPIGPDRGSCGTAAYTRAPVIVSDIAIDPRWVRYRDAALGFGLRACWSVPIVGADQQVLGTFAFYYPRPRAPTPRLLALATHASRVATIAIQRHQQATALRDSEHHLSLVYNHAADVLFHLQVEPEGYRFLSVNPAFGEATGVEPAQVVGKLVRDVIPEPSYGLVVSKYDEAFRTGQTVRWEEVSPYPKGVRRGDVAVTPVFDGAGRPKYLVGAVRDVTEQHRLADELRQLRERERDQLSERLQMATRAASVGVWRWDLVADRLEWDEVMHRLYGVTPAEFGADYRGWAAGVHPADLPRVAAAVEAARRGDTELDTEFRVVWPDGTERHVKANGVVQRDDGGRPVAMVGTNWDITAAKHAEAALRRARDAAEAATHAKSRFLANMSHEIRTPMNAILGYAQMLRRDPELSAAQRHKLDVIHASGDHLLTLIDDVLAMSRIEAGRDAPSAAPFDLHQLLVDVELMFAELTRAKGLALTFELDRALPRVVIGDAGKVKQVAINLLSNAVKFTAAGVIHVAASARRTDVDTDVVTFTVSDTGIGVEPDALLRIFDAFDQTDAGARFGGTGLGLAISRHFARMMGGDLAVASAVGRGSTFTFWFTAGAADDVAIPVVDDGPIPITLELGGARPRVLIVDDVTTNRELLDEMLTRIGFATRVAASGEEALAAHDAWRPDLVLMDLRMPGIGGLEAIRRLRAAGSRAVIIAISASIVEPEQAVLVAGADDFLRKPYRESELLATLGDALGVRYIYATAPPGASVGAPAAPSLAQLAPGLPAALIDQLRDAALAARAERIERLAESVAVHSEPAAVHIRALAATFRYDLLLLALEPGRRHEP